MSPLFRAVLCVVILTCGFAAQAGLEEMSKIERPPLRETLASIPLELGDWVGQDEPVKPEIIEKAQTTEYLNRDYESTTHPGRHFKLWINYSREGNNLRHSPEICLPSSRLAKGRKSECRRCLSVPSDSGRAA